MAELRVDTDLPLFLPRGQAQTLLLEAYLGDVAAPSTASAATFSLARPAGTELISAASCGVVTHTATYALSAIDAGETLGDYWLATWAPVIGGVTYYVEQRAMLVRQLLRCPVTNASLLRVHPSLTTYPNGASSWEPTAIREAWTWTQQCLIETGMRPHKVIGADALAKMTKHKAAGNAFRDIAVYTGNPELFLRLADEHDHEPAGEDDPGGLAQQAWASIRPWYSAADSGLVDVAHDDLYPAARTW